MIFGWRWKKKNLTTAHSFDCTPYCPSMLLLEQDLLATFTRKLVCWVIVSAEPDNLGTFTHHHLFLFFLFFGFGFGFLVCLGFFKSLVVHVGRLTGISMLCPSCTKPKQLSERRYHHGITPSYTKLYMRTLLSVFWCSVNSSRIYHSALSIPFRHD